MRCVPPTSTRPRNGASCPRACANRLARAKADAALKSVQLDDELRGAFILAADTVVAVGRRILPKANLVDEAAQCLRLLSGRNHRVYTAICLVTPKETFRQRLIETRVRFKRLGEEDIQSYNRLRRMARQGRRLRGAGHRRILRGQDGRLLQQHRGLAALRIDDAARGRRFPRALRLAECRFKPKFRRALRQGQGQGQAVPDLRQAGN